MSIDLAGLADFLTGHPVLLTVLQVVTLAVLWFLHVSGKESRARLHRRIDEHMTKFKEHEIECAQRWGEVKATLDQHNQRLE